MLGMWSTIFIKLMNQGFSDNTLCDLIISIREEFIRTKYERRAWFRLPDAAAAAAVANVAAAPAVASPAAAAVASPSNPQNNQAAAAAALFAGALMKCQFPIFDSPVCQLTRLFHSFLAWIGECDAQV
jgi:hypothetical protein